MYPHPAQQQKCILKETLFLWEETAKQDRELARNSEHLFFFSSAGPPTQVLCMLGKDSTTEPYSQSILTNI
jgi:hypothetical protein